MRRFLPHALLAGAALFLLWELYAVTRWVEQAGSLGAAFDHFTHKVGSDWMALIVVSDHLVIAGTVLIALLIDAARQGWSASRLIFLAVAFVALGSPALLVYLAWRLGTGSRQRPDQPGVS
jgi:hypothetical protein